MLLAALLLACTSTSPTAPRWAQWVWTDRDLAPLTEARTQLGAVRAAVHVATVRWDGGAFHNALGLPPGAAGDSAPVIVVRIDDSAHAAWDAVGDEATTAALDAALARVITLVRARGAPIAEVQLDYDVPVRLLPRWGAALRRLRQGALAGQRVWVTSLVSHVRDPAFGPALRGAADGHLLQVFDTGDEVGTAEQIARAARAADLPWRLGVGAFEREGTSHRAWFAEIATACPPPACEEVWVFPAGRSWAALAGPAAPRPAPALP